VFVYSIYYIIMHDTLRHVAVVFTPPSLRSSLFDSCNNRNLYPAFSNNNKSATCGKWIKQKKKSASN